MKYDTRRNHLLLLMEQPPIPFRTRLGGRYYKIRSFEKYIDVLFEFRMSFLKSMVRGNEHRRQNMIPLWRNGIMFYHVGDGPR